MTLVCLPPVSGNVSTRLVFTIKTDGCMREVGAEDLCWPHFCNSLSHPFPFRREDKAEIRTLRMKTDNDHVGFHSEIRSLAFCCQKRV